MELVDLARSQAHTEAELRRDIKGITPEIQKLREELENQRRFTAALVDTYNFNSRITADQISELVDHVRKLQAVLRSYGVVEQIE
jgi:septal ring factor EnvC (AmiA/AmiB activator)